MLAHYYDLTHTIDEVHEIQKTEGKVKFQPFSNKDSPLDAIERLVVPRAKEHSEPLNDEASQSREVRFHGVTLHRRTLPDGWHASPQALELAKELGITLEDNETLVKAHHRGSRALGEVVAHKLVKHPTSLKTEEPDDTLS